MIDSFRKVFFTFSSLLLLTLHVSYAADIQVYTTQNTNNSITPKSIEVAFNHSHLTLLGNNNMNKPFLQRFKKVHYKVYNLAMFMNNDLTYKLLKKYPQFGALTPLTMSIWQDAKGSINIATLTLNGMARVANIPKEDPDLKEYALLIQKALHNALPNGKYKEFSSQTKKDIKKSYQVNLTTSVELEDGEDLEDYIDTFEEEFEAEMESVGFLFPNITNIQDEIFKKYNYNEYDFYHTYSICKFDVIYPISKDHPEAGAWAPCSFYIYKRKGERKMYMGLLGVQNWITTLHITDKESIELLTQTQSAITNILNEVIE